MATRDSADDDPGEEVCYLQEGFKDDDNKEAGDNNDQDVIKKHGAGDHKGKLDELVSKIYFKQMMNGLNHIHSRGVIHRDIKLENIFLNHDKSVAVIGNFSLSNFWTHSANLKTRCGSAAQWRIIDRRSKCNIQFWVFQMKKLFFFY